MKLLLFVYVFLLSHARRVRERCGDSHEKSDALVSTPIFNGSSVASLLLATPLAPMRPQEEMRRIRHSRVPTVNMETQDEMYARMMREMEMGIDPDANDKTDDFSRTRAPAPAPASNAESDARQRWLSQQDAGSGPTRGRQAANDQVMAPGMGRQPANNQVMAPGMGRQATENQRDNSGQAGGGWNPFQGLGRGQTTTTRPSVMAPGMGRQAANNQVMAPTMGRQAANNQGQSASDRWRSSQGNGGQSTTTAGGWNPFQGLGRGQQTTTTRPSVMSPGMGRQAANNQVMAPGMGRQAANNQVMAPTMGRQAANNQGQAASDRWRANQDNGGQTTTTRGWNPFQGIGRQQTDTQATTNQGQSASGWNPFQGSGRGQQMDRQAANNQVMAPGMGRQAANNQVMAPGMGRQAANNQVMAPGAMAPGMGRQAANNQVMAPGAMAPGMGRQAANNQVMPPGIGRQAANNQGMAPGAMAPGMGRQAANNQVMAPGVMAPGMGRQAANDQVMAPGMGRQPANNQGMAPGAMAPGMGANNQVMAPGAMAPGMGANNQAMAPGMGRQALNNQGMAPGVGNQAMAPGIGRQAVNNQAMAPGMGRQAVNNQAMAPGMGNQVMAPGMGRQAVNSQAMAPGMGGQEANNRAPSTARRDGFGAATSPMGRQEAGDFTQGQMRMQGRPPRTGGKSRIGELASDSIANRNSQVSVGRKGQAIDHRNQPGHWANNEGQHDTRRSRGYSEGQPSGSMVYAPPTDRPSRTEDSALVRSNRGQLGDAGGRLQRREGPPGSLEYYDDRPGPLVTEADYEIITNEIFQRMSERMDFEITRRIYDILGRLFK